MNTVTNLLKSTALKFIPVFFLFSCGKNDDKPNEPTPSEPVSVIPYIELKEVSPLTVKAFEEEIVFTIFYKDGDGDIGTKEADINSLFIEDSRGDIKLGYHIQPLAPKDAEIAIQGHLNIVLNNTILFGDGSEPETVVFSVYLFDRAGNQSNIVESPEITVVP